MPKHGILTPSSIVSFSDSKFTHQPLDLANMSIAQAAKYLLSEGFTHAWIEKDCVETEEIQRGYNADEWQHFTPYYRNQRMQGMSLMLKEGVQKGRRQITLIWPDNTSWGSWIKEANAKQLLTTIMYVERELAITMGGSPATMGWKLLDSIHPEWIGQKPNINLGECHFTAAAGPDIIWKSDMLATLQGGFLHKFDKSMAYPYAASNLDPRYGVGTPSLFQGDSFTYLGATGKPVYPKVGVWRCKVTPGANLDVDVMDLPPIKYKEWIAGPYIRLLKSVGYDVEILEGWVFPQEHEIMADWARRMWAGRLSFRDETKWKNPVARGFAEQAMKSIAVATIGFTAFRGFEDDSEKKRPDIRLQTVAHHAEIMYHNMLKLKKDTGHSPVLVYMDAVYYWSPDQSDGRAFLPDLVKREGRFGGFKYEGCIPVDKDVQIIFQGKLNAAATLECLNKIGWV